MVNFFYSCMAITFLPGLQNSCLVFMLHCVTQDYIYSWGGGLNHPGPVLAIFKSKSELKCWRHYEPGEFRRYKIPPKLGGPSRTLIFSWCLKICFEAILVCPYFKIYYFNIKIWTEIVGEFITLIPPPPFKKLLWKFISHLLFLFSPELQRKWNLCYKECFIVRKVTN